MNQINGTIILFAETALNTIVCEQLQTTGAQNLTQMLHQVNDHIRPYLKPVLPAIPPLPPPGVTNLTDSLVIELARYVLNTVVGIDGDANVNKIVNRFTNDTGSVQSKEIFKDGFSVSTTISVAPFGNITLGLSEFNVSELNTWSKFSIFEATDDDYELYTGTQLDKLDINVTFFIIVEVDGEIKSDTLNETAKLIISLSSNKLNFTSQICYFEEKLLDLIGDQNMQIIDNPELLFTVLSRINITLFEFGVHVDNLQIVAESGDIEKEFDQAIDNILQVFVKEYTEAIPAFWNGYVAGPVRIFGNEYINAVISNYSEVNVSTDMVVFSFGYDETDTMLVIYAASGCYAIIFLFLIYKTMKKPSPDSTPLLKKPLDNLAFSDVIPNLLRFGIPLLIILNIGLFISANLSVGASVYILLSVGEKKIRIPALFSFSLANSVRDMWRAKVYPLSILIGVFSGGWPYAKLLLMLFSWFLPTTVLGLKNRERILMFLDAFGKWSLVDAFVLTLMMVAFRFHMAPPNISTAMDVFVDPQWGVYCFIIATMLSLLISHILLFYHRKSLKQPLPTLTLNEDNQSPPNQSLAVRTYPYHKTPIYLINFILLLCISLIISGSILPSFSFQFEGAAALVLAYLNQTTTQPYSIVTLGLSIPESSENLSSGPTGPGLIGIVGSRYIQITFYLFAMVVPLLQLTVLLYMWMAPMPLHRLKKVMVIAEVFGSWGAVDVFVVSIVAAVLEIDQFAQFIIGGRCDLINQILKDYFDKALNGKDKCFGVVTELQRGCYLLITGCVLYFFLNYFIHKSCHNSLTVDTEEQSEHSEHSQHQSE
uniref:Uncharacterized protein n=1 Tax=Arcella intermedia TaxID=1963864 RepID=A0A6B2KY53_9EUKA